MPCQSVFPPWTFDNNLSLLFWGLNNKWGLYKCKNSKTSEAPIKFNDLVQHFEDLNKIHAYSLCYTLPSETNYYD